LNQQKQTNTRQNFADLHEKQQLASRPFGLPPPPPKNPPQRWIKTENSNLSRTGANFPFKRALEKKGTQRPPSVPVASPHCRYADGEDSAQIGLRSLRFLDKTSGGKEGWKAVERSFEEMNDPVQSYSNRIDPSGCPRASASASVSLSSTTIC
jgi:hypothetical protein